MRESLVAAIFGAQLTLGGAILVHAEIASKGQGGYGVLMFFFGIAFGLLATARAYRFDKDDNSS